MKLQCYRCGTTLDTEDSSKLIVVESRHDTGEPTGRVSCNGVEDCLANLRADLAAANQRNDKAQQDLAAEREAHAQETKAHQDAANMWSNAVKRAEQQLAQYVDALESSVEESNVLSEKHAAATRELSELRAELALTINLDTDSLICGVRRLSGMLTAANAKNAATQDVLKSLRDFVIGDRDDANAIVEMLNAVDDSVVAESR